MNKFCETVFFLALLAAIGFMGGMDTAEGADFLIGAVKVLVSLAVAYGAAYKGGMLL